MACKDLAMARASGNGMEFPDAEDMDCDSLTVDFDNVHSFMTSTASSIKVGISSTSGVHELLECPVCANSMYPPIHQCPNGHTLCSKCKATVQNRCPICRQELGNIRCLALEKVAESLELPCRYLNVGCSEIFPYYSKLKHEQLCRYRPYNCPYAGSECLVSGDIPTLVAHLRDNHKVDMHDGCTFNHRYVKSNPHEVENATWMLTALTILLVGCFSRHIFVPEGFSIPQGIVASPFQVVAHIKSYLDFK